jgi:serine/threonine protein phosphatase 1
MTNSIYAMGDSHAHLSQVENALDLIARDMGSSSAEVIFLGDYVDRGPHARALLDLLIAGPASAQKWTILKGNHDRMFCRFVDDGRLDDPHIKTPGLDWLHPRLGGSQTLASYGVETDNRAVDQILFDAQQAIPSTHLDFLKSLPLTAQRADKLFVHAGIRPDVALQDQTDDDLMWIRDPFLDHTAAFPWLVVHGHTAGVRPVHKGNRVNLDCGAGYGNPLVPVVFEGDAAFTLTPHGRVTLQPE